MKAKTMRIFLFALSIGVGGAGAAFAQDDSAASVCAAMPTESERAACMRGVDAARAAMQAPDAGGDEDEDNGFLGLGVFGGDNGRTTPAAGLGAETLNAPANSDAEEERVRATIVAFREPVPGIYEFELDNGQVWRQLSGDGQTIHLSSHRAEPVEMWLSWAGGYRMRLLNHRQTIRVQRLR